MKAAAPQVTLRPAGPTDSRQVLAWSNDPDARAASFSVEPIGAEAHARWYARALEGERSLFVIESDGEPAGLVRLDPIDAVTAEVGIVVAPAYRGRGIATLALGSLIAKATAAGLESLIARIRVENARSRKLFAASGFGASRNIEVRNIAAVELRRKLA